MDTMWTLRKAPAWRVWAHAWLIGAVGGGALGGLTWTVLCLAGWSPWTAMLWVPGLLMSVPVGAAVGLPAGVVGGGVLALAQARSQDGLTRARARLTAAPPAGLVVLAFALANPGNPRWVLEVVLPSAVVTAGLAALVAPAMVAPRPRAVSARRTGAGAAAGTASPGWSRAPGR